jgi:hypothetical protein
MNALITLHVLEASAFKISFMQHPQLTVVNSIHFFSASMLILSCNGTQYCCISCVLRLMFCNI